MPIKISKIAVSKAKNCKIHPVLYHFFLRLKDTLGAEIVHRRTRKSSMAIEIIFWNEEFALLKGRVNTLKEAEQCGFWIICRPQTNPKHMFYKDHRVFQLFLSPVHPFKRREQKTTITPLSMVQRAAVSGI